MPTGATNRIAAASGKGFFRNLLGLAPNREVEAITQRVKVLSRPAWMEPPASVKIGDTLSPRAEGTWFDAFIPCSADGYRCGLFYKLGFPPRIPDGDRFFRLMGRIVPNGLQPASDDVRATFVIGRAREVIAGLCPAAWCRIAYIIAPSGKLGQSRQAATAGSLTMESSLNPAMVSSVI